MLLRLFDHEHFKRFVGNRFETKSPSPSNLIAFGYNPNINKPFFTGKCQAGLIGYIF